MTTSYAKPIPSAPPSFASARAHAEEVERELIGVEMLRAHHDEVEEYVREQGMEWARRMLQAQVALGADRARFPDRARSRGIWASFRHVSPRNCG